MGAPDPNTDSALSSGRSSSSGGVWSTIKLALAGTELDYTTGAIGRAIVRLSAGAENYGVLKHHVIDSARLANELYRSDGTDRYMYQAPVLMIFHASRRGISYQENAHLVCHHAMLAAVSLGLGTTIIGMIPPVVERAKKLRTRYGIPDDHRVLTSLIMGYPKYRYRRGICRDLAGVTYH